MDKNNIKKEFINPSILYRGKPFWSWNGELKEKELIRQAKIMKEMGLGGFFMHSRAGLITEYLGEEWFDLINKVADAAEEEGMEAWLYDEDRYPSGSAELRPLRDSRQHLHWGCPRRWQMPPWETSPDNPDTECCRHQ